MQQKIAFVKTGWSEEYKGGPVTGRHGYIQENRTGIFGQNKRVTDGARTHNHWSHNPELHLLSYGHHRQVSHSEHRSFVANRAVLAIHREGLLRTSFTRLSIRHNGRAVKYGFAPCVTGPCYRKRKKLDSVRGALYNL